MTINFIYNYFNKHNLIRATQSSIDNNVIYLFAKNYLRLGRIEKYDEHSFICFYRAGEDNGKEHNMILYSEDSLEILIPYLLSIYTREYKGIDIITSEFPVIKIKGKEFYQSQRVYLNKPPKRERNLTKI